MLTVSSLDPRLISSTRRCEPERDRVAGQIQADVGRRPLYRSLGLRRTAKQMTAVRTLHVDSRRRTSVGERLGARGPAHRARWTAWGLIRPGFRFRPLAHCPS